MSADEARSLAAATASVLRRRARTNGLWIDVDGTSMAPTIRPPARVLVVAAEHPRPGEIWAFVDDDGAVVVHRYLRRRRTGSLLLRGDGMHADDGFVVASHLVGRVARIEDVRGTRGAPARYWPVVRSFAAAAGRRARGVVTRVRRSTP